MGIIIPNMGTENFNRNPLFSDVQKRLLSLFYGHPDKNFYTNEVIRLTHSGTGAVQRELNRLTDSGILTVKKVGNQKHYQANHDSPIFSELRSIVLKTFGLADVLRQTLKPLRDKIYIAFIFGSIAKQQDNIKSDIDIMLLSNTLHYSDLFQILQKSEGELGRIINPTFYSVAEWKRKIEENNNFIMQVLNQPKIFLIGDEDELRKFG
jgi:predicted nucleotidyltransferase